MKTKLLPLLPVSPSYIHKNKTIQSYLVVSPCIHNQCGLCKACPKRDTAECGLEPVLADADVISAAFLEETYTAKSRKFLKENRQKHRVLATHEILGEVVVNLFTKGYDERRFPSILPELHSVIEELGVVEPLTSSQEFRDVLKTLSDTTSLRCGSRDRINIATAFCIGCKFYTYDKGVIMDGSTIDGELYAKFGKHFKLKKSI